MGGVLSDELRRELLKKSNLTVLTAHDYCRTFEVAVLQKIKFNTPTHAATERSLGIHPVRKFKVQEKKTKQTNKQTNKKTLVPVRFVVIGTNLPSHFASLPLEKSAANAKKRDTLHICTKKPSDESSQVAAVKQEISLSHDVHTYLGSVELNSVSSTRKKS